MSLFNFLLLEEKHCKEASDFLGGIFPNSDLNNEQVLRWQLIDTPDIRPVSVLARSTEAPHILVGMLSAIPQKFLVNGKTLVGAYLANAAVDPSVRTLIWKNEDGQLENIFLSLARKIKENARSSGWDFLYVIPNELSVRAYRKNLNYSFSRKTPLFARPVNAGRLLGTRIRSANLANFTGAFVKAGLSLWGKFRFLFSKEPEISKISGFDTGLDDLLRSQGEQLGRKKSIADLNHRFTECPHRKYETYLASKDDRPIGYLVIGQSTKYYGEQSIQCGMVADFYYLPSESSTSAVFFSKAIRDYEQSHDIDIWLCLAHENKALESTLRKNLFFDVTDRFPREFLLMVDPVSDLTPESILNTPYHFGDYDVV